MNSHKVAVAADLDDLLFAGRNRKYGAYELRKNYDKRLTVALLAAVSFFVLTLAGLNLLPNPKLDLTIISPKHPTEPQEVPLIFDDQIVPPHKLQHRSGGFPFNVTKDPVSNDTAKIQGMIGMGNGNLLDGLTDNDGVGDDPFGLPAGYQVKVKPQIFDPAPDQNAEFPGGEKAYENYLQSNIKYPNFAAANGIEGTIWLSLKIDEEGNIVDVTVLRSIGGGCDEEAARVLRGMPRWKPGRKDGENIAVMRYVKVNMVLK
jgi:periplasmic protein TonB